MSFENDQKVEDIFLSKDISFLYGSFLDYHVFINERSRYSISIIFSGLSTGID